MSEDQPPTRSAERRKALAAILGAQAEPILERTVGELVRLSDFVGLGESAAGRYVRVTRSSIPLAVRAMGSPDPERSLLLDEYAGYVKELVRTGIPAFVQRSLMHLGFRAASGIARDAANAHGFAADELEDELRLFQRDFEARLLNGS